MSATALIGLFLEFKFLIIIFDLSLILLALHLLGLKGLIGLIESFFESKLKIGPWTDKLYAVLPAGVETKTPSQINFLIKILLFLTICNDAACLVCLNKDISLIGGEYVNNKITTTNDYISEKLSDILELCDNFSRPASYGKESGKYKFYTSGEKVKFVDNYDIEEKRIINNK